MDAWEDECSVSELSCMGDPHDVDGGAREFNMTRYDGESGRNSEEPYHLQDNIEDHSLSDGTTSLMSIGKKIDRSNSCQSLGDSAVGTAEDANDYCTEVQCIEVKDRTEWKFNYEPRSVSNGGNKETLALTAFGDGDAAGSKMSTEASGDRKVNHRQNGFAYDVLEQRLHHVQGAIDALASPYPDDTPSPEPLAADMSSSRSMQLNRNWSCRENLVTGSSPCFDKAEQIESTPPNGLEKPFSGRPEGFRRRFPPLNYSANTASLSRNDSQSSIGSVGTDDLRAQSIKTSADEDLHSIHDFVAGLKEMAEQEYERKLVDGLVRIFFFPFPSIPLQEFASFLARHLLS